MDEQNLQDISSLTSIVFTGGATPLLYHTLQPRMHCTLGWYCGARSKNSCYYPIPKFWQDFETQSQNLNVVSDRCFRYKTIRKPLITPNQGIPRISSNQ